MKLRENESRASKLRGRGHGYMINNCQTEYSYHTSDLLLVRRALNKLTSRELRAMNKIAAYVIEKIEYTELYE